MDSYLDANQSVRLLPHCGGDDGFGNGIGKAVGVSRGNIFGVLVHGLAAYLSSGGLDCVMLDRQRVRTTKAYPRRYGAGGRIRWRLND